VSAVGCKTVLELDGAVRLRSEWAASAGLTENALKCRLRAGLSLREALTRPPLSDWHKTHPLYETWRGMRKRCNNPKAAHFRDYGGRGIRVFPEWDANFEQFLKDVGKPPTAGMQIDRIDNDGNYEPGNVRWATAKEQARNRRSTMFVEIDGARVPLALACEIKGVAYGRAYRQIRAGVPPRDALRETE
jgi:hypothetical protein